MHATALLAQDGGDPAEPLQVGCEPKLVACRRGRCGRLIVLSKIPSESCSASFIAQTTSGSGLWAKLQLMARVLM